MQRQTIQVTLILASLVLLTGCSRAYNGSFKLGGDPASEPWEVQTTRDQADLDRLTKAIEPESEPVVFAQIAEPSDPVVHPRTPQPIPRRDRVQAPSGLSLFGQVSQVSTTPLSLEARGNVRQVSFASEGADFDPAVSPDGQTLVFASTRHRETSDIYVQRVGSEAVTQLTRDTANDAMPACSADGKQIAFASDRSGNWDIYVMPADGGQATQITHDTAHEVHPTFSHDGKRLAYCRMSETSGQWEIVVVDLEQPGAPHYLGPGLMPHFSPTDDRLLYQRARERGSRWFSIWSIEFKGDQLGPPTEIVSSPRSAAITPAWSSDGKRLVFCMVDDPQADEQERPARAEVWVADIDGSRRQQLTSGPFRNLQPAWASDGTIYFVSNRRGPDNIWAVEDDAADSLAQDPGSQAQTPASP
ncbi:MAG: TolB family protein [Phycisphaeraceae bacterium]